MSGEHMISKSVLEVLKRDKLVVSGFPWISDGKEISVGINSLTANRLCTSHNSDLSRLDQVAGRFFSALNKCFIDQEVSGSFSIFSGHDIERWFLKTLAGLSASDNLSDDQSRRTEGIEPGIRVDKMLENPGAWKFPTGMFINHQIKEEFGTDLSFQMAPLTSLESGKIMGLVCSIFGLRFSLLAGVPASLRGITNIGYRPGLIHVVSGSVIHKIKLCWEDGMSHGLIKAERFSRPN